MGRLFVGGGRLGGPVDLLQNEAPRIISLLDPIEPGNLWLLHTGPRIGESGIDESRNGLRQDMNMNVNNQHGAPIMQRATVLLN